MMRKGKMLIAAAAVSLMLAGCGQGGQTETAPSAETEASEEVRAEETEPETPDENEGAVYEDNFEVDREAVKEFGEKIQLTVAAKDLKQLADLTAFPVYVGLPGTEGTVESREEFMDIGAEQIFTPELVASVTAADPDELSPSMAGFVLSDGGTANVIFGVSGGKLAVTGINY